MSPDEVGIGTIAVDDDVTDGFARLQLMIVGDVIRPARLRLVGCLGRERIRIPPAIRADVVTVEGSTITIGCTLLEVTITDEVSDKMVNVGSGSLRLIAVEAIAVRAV